jgi:hypothetical protein
MVSNSDVSGRPSRRIVLLTKLKRTTMRLGAMTQAFFVRGEQLEATGFENVPHDDPTLVPPKLGFRGFDRIPRNRAPLLIVFLLVAATLVGVVGRRSVRDVGNRTAGFAGSFETKMSNESARLKAFVGSRPAAPQP